jgi:hypothetical protein
MYSPQTRWKGYDFFSTNKTSLPAFDSRCAATNPAKPPPMIKISVSCMFVQALLSDGRAVYQISTVLAKNSVGNRVIFQIQISKSTVNP